MTIQARESAAGAVKLDDFRLVGEFAGDQAAFTLSGMAHVADARGGSIEVLGGPVALTELGPHPKWRVSVDGDRYVVSFDRAGKFPFQLKFNAAVRSGQGGKAIEFHVVPGVLQPIVLRGLAADTKFEFAGAARPQLRGAEFVSLLPSDGVVKLSWKEARPEAEGKLFYAAEMLSQVSVSPGLMRQVALINGRVMQGELSRIAFRLRGPGEVTRVQGEQVLAWNVEPASDPGDRRLVVQFNQPQKDQFALQIQAQTPLAAFPQTADVIQLRPEGATRFAGCFRIVNEGAVRLEVVQSSGLSQISPEQFPETDATRALLRPDGSQRFAYRFSEGDFALRLQADQILPELGVSQVLAYHLGENELAIDAEIELDVREAPLRELQLRVPKGYVIARLNAPGSVDYFLRDPEDQPDAELRLVYGQPAFGRQVIDLRLEYNHPLVEAAWVLPRVEIPRAKSVRGHIGVAADAGFRVTPERTQGLTEIATAFFPGKIAGLQSAFRLSDPGWQATVRAERLPQTIQADALHLFSIGEGIAYGSSLINYVVSGAPVSAFKVELSDEYFNVEFTGREVRNWQKIDGGYLVQLHTPVSGAYSLLATYERPFKAQGESLTFSGARSLNAQSEQGYTLIISAMQFQVKTEELSPGLIALEPGEVPSQYRLFFDAPILKAYRYTSRPFDLKLTLASRAQGESLSQVVDRATLTTHVSKEGAALTDARYFVKNRGNPHFRIELPEATQLWSVSVNGAPVVPVIDGQANLIPLPQHADPNEVLTVDLKLAAASKSAERVSVGAPKVNAPVMLCEWKLEADADQRLVWGGGSLTPMGGVPDTSGFAQLARAFAADGRAVSSLLAALGLTAAALILWRWAGREGVLRPGGRGLFAVLMGFAALVLAVAAFIRMGGLADQQRADLPSQLTFLAPVQQPNSALNIIVANVEARPSMLEVVGPAWPALIALPVWVYGLIVVGRRFRTACWIGGWLLLAWATLRSPNGAVVFVVMGGAFLLLHAIIPVLWRLWHLRRESALAAAPPIPGGASSGATALLIAGLLCLEMGAGTPLHGSDLALSQGAAALHDDAALPETVVQDVRVEDKYAVGTARIRWQAAKGQTLPLLFEPAVLTRLSFPSNALALAESPAGSKAAQRLRAERDGLFDVEIQYELPVVKRDTETGLALPIRCGLVNRVNLTLVNLDVDVLSPQAVSVQRDAAGSNTVAAVVLSPGQDLWLGWKPRSRDVKREKPVFYAELTQLYVPAAGVIEGAHSVSIRPAQGELSELILEVPPGATITDVTDSAGNSDAKNRGSSRGAESLVSLWRFDPDARKLRVTLSPAQSRPFALLIRSQIPVGPLPLERSVRLVSVVGAAGELGLLGIATGNEVQLDSVAADGFSPINLEDYPGEAAGALQGQVPGLTVRRAFRYGRSSATVVLKASAVEPDVRVETQDTLSLGEDRTVLAVNAAADITRAGIFRLSFLLPPGFDVESVSGAALSHWTESKIDQGRLITLHLTGRTEGRQEFAISLAGAGVKPTANWLVPQVNLREASKQRGTLLLVPEQGTRLQVAARDGVTQLDPQKSGIRQKGVLAFSVLQTPWKLGLDIEQVEPWIQVAGLQHATVQEAQVKVLANLQYQIENTGLKAFRLFLPTNSENVRFQGEQVADSMPVAGAITNGLQLWEVKLSRRVLGAYRLQATYQTPIPAQASETILRGVLAADVNLQRGFVTIQSSGRLQVRAEAATESLQPAEWQSIPRNLQCELSSAAADFSYRLVEPSFALHLKLERHEAAKLLPARIQNISLASAISDGGVMLTRVCLQMLPGDEPTLSLTLPKDARFWFAFVDHNGVWPCRDQGNLLIPLQPQSGGRRPIPVEFFYSCAVGSPKGGALDLELLAPKFSLPLEDVTWRVSLSENWRVRHWSGTLQLDSQETLPENTLADAASYLQQEAAIQQERTKQAEGLLAAGNTALEQGDPQQARRAFQAAYGLSAHDAAFNEDARVQLHNIKLQQALVGLNVRQAATGAEPGALPAGFRDLRNGKEPAYTQQDAKDIIDRNTADENAAFMRLADRLIQQQDAAVSAANPVRADIPEQGRVLTFKRSVVVNPQTDLKLALRFSGSRRSSSGARVLILGCVAAVLLAFGLAGRRAGVISGQPDT